MINSWSKEQILLNITYIIAGPKASDVPMITFWGFGIVAPWILWVVLANANFIGNWITFAVFTSDFLDWEMEKGSLLFQ